jgi:hypothetical protein
MSSHNVDEWRQLRLHHLDRADLHGADVNYDGAGTKVRTNLPQRRRQVADGNSKDHKVTTPDVADIAEPDMSERPVLRGQRGIAGDKREIRMQMRSDQPAEGAEAKHADGSDLR